MDIWYVFVGVCVCVWKDVCVYVRVVLDFSNSYFFCVCVWVCVLDIFVRVCVVVWFEIYW